MGILTICLKVNSAVSDPMAFAVLDDALNVQHGWTPQLSSVEIIPGVIYTEIKGKIECDRACAKRTLNRLVEAAEGLGLQILPGDFVSWANYTDVIRPGESGGFRRRFAAGTWSWEFFSPQVLLADELPTEVLSAALERRGYVVTRV